MATYSDVGKNQVISSHSIDLIFPKYHFSTLGLHKFLKYVLVDDKDTCILHRQYHGYWWSLLREEPGYEQPQYWHNSSDIPTYIMHIYRETKTRGQRDRQADKQTKQERIFLFIFCLYYSMGNISIPREITNSVFIMCNILHVPFILNRVKPICLTSWLRKKSLSNTSRDPYRRQVVFRLDTRFLSKDPNLIANNIMDTVSPNVLNFFL